jgi:hypothetical protein
LPTRSHELARWEVVSRARRSGMLVSWAIAGPHLDQTSIYAPKSAKPLIFADSMLCGTEVRL